MDAWIETYTGVKFYLNQYRLDDIRIEDIAHSLSLLCRYNGHCKSFFSVGEHSVRVSRIVPPEDKLMGLLHDAAEAYVGDISRPVKYSFPDIKELELKIQADIFTKFNVTGNKAAVKLADDIMLATEAKTLMKWIEDWDRSGFCNEQPLDEIIVPWWSEVAEMTFLAEFYRCTRKL